MSETDDELDDLAVAVAHHPASPIEETARHVMLESQKRNASAAPAIPALKPKRKVPGSPIEETARQLLNEAQYAVASAASTKADIDMKSNRLVSRPSSKGRHDQIETQSGGATPTPAIMDTKPNGFLPGSPLSVTVEAIRAHHRERRFAMGIQQMLDRKLESYIRINKTEWHVGDDEATRDKANKEVAAKIKAARKGEGDPSIIKVVRMTDDARGPADAERARHEHEMESLARSLPVAPWVDTVPGFGMLGLATIIAETGDLSMYANVDKVWKRLGYAPYNGKAGSTWKRPTWRNGDAALTADEWTENPFSGRRYSLIHVISVWLKNKQWIGAGKTEDGVGKPNGKYGEVYAARRARTAETHADWSKQHSHMDALRVMMKEVLKDLWLQWNGVERKAVDRHTVAETQTAAAITATPARNLMKPNRAVPGSPIENARQTMLESQTSDASETPAIARMKPNVQLPGSPIEENARQVGYETQAPYASATPARQLLKSSLHVPGSPLSRSTA